MKSRYLVAAGATLMLALAACSYGTGSPGASSPGASSGGGGGGAVTLTVSHTSAGDSLAGANGMTLYVDTKEQNGTIACTGGCAQAWPPLVGTATAGSGVTGSLGTITRPDGSVQVTYNGAPLYYYATDAAAGDATGQGVGGIWFIAAPSGAAASAAPSPSSTVIIPGY